MTRRKLTLVDDIAAGARDRLADLCDGDLVADSITRAIFSGVTRQTLYRWERDPRLGFPAAHKVCGRKYRLAGELKRYRQLHFGF